MKKNKRTTTEMFHKGFGGHSSVFNREGHIPVPGGKVWYQIIAKNKPGIPLLALHGGPGASHHYLKPLADLTNERPVIFYDQLGCGNSENPNDVALWNIERFVNELDQVIRALELKEVHLLGQSWGAALAVEYLLTKQPQSIKSLILSGPLLSASRWVEDQKAHIDRLPEKAKKAIQQGEESGIYDSKEYQDAMMVFYQKHLCRLDEWPDYLNTAFAKLNMAQYEYMWGPSEFTLKGTLKNYERADQLNKITLPTLITCGEYDEASPATGIYYQEKMPGSRLYVIKGASHEHHIEKREEYMGVVRKFLKSVEKESLAGSE